MGTTLFFVVGVLRLSLDGKYTSVFECGSYTSVFECLRQV